MLDISPARHAKAHRCPWEVSDKPPLRCLQELQELLAIGALFSRQDGGLPTLPLEMESSAEVPVDDLLPEVLPHFSGSKEIAGAQLAISRSDSGQSEGHRLASVAREVLRLAGPLFPDGLNVRTRMSTEGRVGGSPAASRQVVGNLLVNAVRAMDGIWDKAPTVLEVAVDDLNVSAQQESWLPRLQAGPYVRLAVSDTGEGMSSDLLRRALETTFSTRDGAEIGTGLPVALRHVQSLGGTILARSEQGVGATFEAYFPWLSTPEKESKPSSRGSSGLGGNVQKRQVLVVDSDELALGSARDCLSSLGHEPVLRASGDQALEVCRERDIDLAVAAHRTPEMGGLDLAFELRKRGIELPVFVKTNLHATLSEAEARASGADGIIRGPSTAHAVREALRDCKSPAG